MNDVRQIIEKAIELHAAEFRAAMITQAEFHDDIALRTFNAMARRGAETQRNACLNVYSAIAGGLDQIPGGDIDAIVNVLSNCVIALNAACKLLGIDYATRTVAIIDWEAKQKAAGLWH